MRRHTRVRAVLTALFAWGASAGLALAQPTIPPGGGVDPNSGTAVTPEPIAPPPAADTVDESHAPDEPSNEEIERSIERRLRALNDSIDQLLSIPETPAAFAIGTTGEAVARPGTLRDAALEIVSLYDAEGDLKPGFTGEFAPFRILYEDATVDEWQKNANLGRHILDSVRLSLATAHDPAATGSDAPVLVSLGLRLSFIDDRDYRRNAEFVSAVRRVLSTCFPTRIEASGDGIFEGTGYTSVDPSDACSTARDARHKAKQLELTLRKKLGVAEQDSRRVEAVLLVARSAVDQVKARKAEREAVLQALQGHAATDAARANALAPLIDSTRSELEGIGKAVVAAEAKLVASEQAARASAQAAESVRAEHALAVQALAQANSKLARLNDAGDFIATERELEARFLTRGSRLELAFASVLSDRGIGDGGARFRQARGWLAYEYSFGTAALGAAGDLTLSDESAVLGSEDTLVDGRLGARVNFAAGGVDAGLAGGLALLQDRSNAAEYGGTVELKFAALGAARTGLFVRTPFDGAPSELIAILAVSTASGESVFKRAHSSSAAGK